MAAAMLTAAASMSAAGCVLVAVLLASQQSGHSKRSAAVSRKCGMHGGLLTSISFCSILQCLNTCPSSLRISIRHKHVSLRLRASSTACS
eukprot:5510349-Pleurochrysis_carterae.AAC.5